MKIPKIYIADQNKLVSVETAIKILTDDWIDDGNYCAQTVIDLRDALVYYKLKCEKSDKKEISVKLQPPESSLIVDLRRQPGLKPLKSKKEKD